MMNEQPETANGTPRPPNGDARQRAKSQLLADYLEEARQEPSTLLALINVNNGEMWEVAGEIHDAILAELQESSDKLATLEELAPELEMWLKLHRQADRYLQVANKISPPSESERPPRAVLPGTAPVENPMTSEEPPLDTYDL